MELLDWFCWRYKGLGLFGRSSCPGVDGIFVIIISCRVAAHGYGSCYFGD